MFFSAPRNLPLGVAAVALLGAAALAGVVHSLAQEKAAGDKPAVARPETAEKKTDMPAIPKVEPSVAAEAEEANGEASDFAKLFPVGRTFEGVVIPSYAGDGLSSVTHAEYMRRADDEHLEMEMLEIVIYNGGEPDSRILTDRAIFDMEAQVLRSTTPARIIQKQMVMRGDRMIFDRETNIGHMTGNVKTRIQQVDQLMSPGKVSGGNTRASPSSSPTEPPTPTQPEKKEPQP